MQLVIFFKVHLTFELEIDFYLMLLELFLSIIGVDFLFSPTSKWRLKFV